MKTSIVFLFVAVSLVTVSASQVVLTAEPQTLDVTRPEPLTVNCSFDSQESDSKWTPPVSLYLRHAITANTFAEVASVNIFTGVVTSPFSKEVDGIMDRGQNHLAVTWHRPIWSQSGRYQCEAFYVDAATGKTHDSVTHSVEVYANPPDVATLSMMFADLLNERIILRGQKTQLLKNLTKCNESQSPMGPVVDIIIPEVDPVSDGNKDISSDDVTSDISEGDSQVDREDDTPTSDTQDVDGGEDSIDSSPQRPGNNEPSEETPIDDLFHVIETSDSKKYYVSKERFEDLGTSEASCGKFQLDLAAFEGDGEREFTELTSKLEELQTQNSDMKGFLTGARNIEGSWIFTYRENGTEIVEYLQYFNWYGDEPDQPQTNFCMTVSISDGSWFMQDFPCINKFNSLSSTAQYYPIYYVCE